MATNLLVPSLPKGKLIDEVDRFFLERRAADSFARHQALRIFAFARHLADRFGVDVSSEALYVAAHLGHPAMLGAGLPGRNRVDRMWRQASGILEGRAPELVPLVKDWIRYQGSILPVTRRNPHAEMLRRALVIENTRGIISYRLPTMVVLGVFKHFAAHRFDRLLVSAWITVVRHLPFSLGKGIR